MKKLLALSITLFTVIAMYGCADNNINTIPSLTDPTFEELYNLYYDGEDFDVYKLKELSNEHTDDLVDLGVYQGDSYYLTSGTYLEYYVVVKDTVQKDLLEALEADWFGLEELVEDFNLPTTELGFEAYLDEELLQAVRDVKNSLSGESFEELAQHNLARITPLGMTIKTPVKMEDNLTITPYTKDQEWIDVQIKYYTMLEEIVLNGYQQGTYVNLKDFLNSPESLDTYWLSNDQEFQIIISLEEQTLFSRVITYSTSDFTEKLFVETVYADINLGNNLHLEKYVSSYITDSIGVDIYEENKGVYQITVEDGEVTFISGSLGSVVDSNIQFSLYQIVRSSIYELNDIKINFYNQNEEVYLRIQLLNNQNTVSYIEYVNNIILESTLSYRELSTLIFSYNELLYNEQDNLTTGLTFRVDEARMASLIEDINALKEQVNRYENYYAKPNYPSEMLVALRNVEIDGNIFNVLSDNGQIDLSVLGIYEELYEIIDYRSSSYLDSYRTYLSEYNNALDNETKASALRGLYSSIYSLQPITNWDNTLIQYFTGDTLGFTQIDLEVTVYYDYNVEVLPGSINNDEESISNAATYWYQYIQDNYDSMFYKFNNFGISDYNNPLLVDYIHSKAITIE